MLYIFDDPADLSPERKRFRRLLLLTIGTIVAIAATIGISIAASPTTFGISSGSRHVQERFDKAAPQPAAYNQSQESSAAAVTKRGHAIFIAQMTTVLRNFTGSSSWYYSWTVTPWEASAFKYSSSLPTPMEYVPMQWGSSQIENLSTSLASAVQSGHAKHLLGFNEPDIPKQSNLTVTEAARLWPALEAAAFKYGLKLGSPAPSDPKWLQYFFTECDRQFCIEPEFGGGNGTQCLAAMEASQGLDVAQQPTVQTPGLDTAAQAQVPAVCRSCAQQPWGQRGCRMDFVAGHAYRCNLDEFKGVLEGLKAFGLPVWVTEFGCVPSWEIGWRNATNVEEPKGYEDMVLIQLSMLDILDSDPMVARYAWWTHRATSYHDGNNTFHQMYHADSWDLTPVGKVYKEHVAGAR